MKQSFLLSLLLAAASALWSQPLVITEILYNPPDGPDTLEFIEIYNNGQDVVNLMGYTLDGVEFTFPSFNLESQEYVLVAKDSVAMLSAFGVTAFQWVSGGLNNGGELIAVLNPSGAVVDSVEFDDSNGWPLTADGSGPSIVLCNPAADNNDPANWQAANTPTGYVTEGVEILANPGGASNCSSGPLIYFPVSSLEVAEDGGSASVMVVMKDGDGTPTTVMVVLNAGGSTAVNGSDFDFAPVQVTFDNVPVDTQLVTVSIINDAEIEGLETVVLNLESASANASIDNARASVTLTIADDDAVIPKLVINEIMYNNPGGDTYEFLELFNNDPNPVQMGGYTLSSAITYTFADMTLAPGGYIVLAIDSALFEQNLGVPALQFSGQLNNTGEPIELRDPLGNLVDLVTYSSSAPWDANANGAGGSLELCDPDSDNELPASWKASKTGTGFFINGIEVLATPGAANDCSDAPPVTYPPYAVGLVTSADADGQVDSLGVTCEIQGVVYGGNLRPGGLQFTLIDDQNDGIGVFETTGDYGYAVAEGDQIIIRGKVNQFNGLAQIDPDTLILVSSGNNLFAPTVVSALGEATESQLVKINNLTIVDPGQWTNSGSGFTVQVTDGASTFDMRVDNDVNIFGSTPPTVPFNLTGIGGQFDSSSPYTEGYQILPRYLGDIELLNAVVDPGLAQGLIIHPNPASDQVWLTAGVQPDRIQVYNPLGQRVRDLIPDGTTAKIELSGLPNGIYVLKVIKGHGIWSEQIVKQ